MIRRILTYLLLSIALAHSTFAQQYHAVLITGGCPWYEGKAFNDMFWNDTYLMWETLKNHGYDVDNIHVLYYDGMDFPESKPRYTRPYGTAPVTDAPANYADVQSTFATLANTMTNNDVLLIWTFGHGDTRYNNISALVLHDSEILDSDFADLVNSVPCAKRIILMAQCYGGGFIDNLEGNKTVILTACGANELAQTADNINPDGDDPAENEGYGEDTCRHSEFNYHVLNAMRNATICENAPVESDVDYNGGVSMNEAKEFEFQRDSYQNYDPPKYHRSSCRKQPTQAFPRILGDDSRSLRIG